ncbi:hypothetical protein PF011_g10164 [Phytophthora fragariae]|nr:hypothetical protein PF011_g10164 [Phytophthora fragariae]
MLPSQWRQQLRTLQRHAQRRHAHTPLAAVRALSSASSGASGDAEFALGVKYLLGKADGAG